MHIALSINKVSVRLTAERWFHIVENHDDLAGCYDDILDTIEKPDLILNGHKSVLIAIRRLKERRFLTI